MEAVVEILDGPYHEGTKRLKLNTQAKLDEVLTHPQCPVFLHSVLFGKVTWQMRSEFNVGRTLAAPGLAPQWVGALLAWGARVDLEDGRGILLAEAPGQAGSAGSLSLPLEVPGRLWAEARTGSTPNDFPIVWALVVLDVVDGIVQNARIALTGAWRQSVALAESAELLVGKKLDAETIQQVAAAVAKEAAPVGDYRGGEEYRKDMAGVMTRRALETCLEGVEA
jgi:CO/xanthine dehydrogenase FAD-binding subunit